VPSVGTFHDFKKSFSLTGQFYPCSTRIWLLSAFLITPVWHNMEQISTTCGTNEYYLWNKSTNIWQLLMVQYKHTFWQFWTWLDIAHYWNVLYADELKQQCKKS